MLEDGPQNNEALSAVFVSTANSSLASLQINGLRFKPNAREFAGMSLCIHLKSLSFNFLIGDYAMYPSDDATWLAMLASLSKLQALESLTLAASLMLSYASRPLAVARANALGHLRDINLEALELSSNDEAVSCARSKDYQGSIRYALASTLWMGWH